jgi:hypothetical protein
MLANCCTSGRKRSFAPYIRQTNIGRAALILSDANYSHNQLSTTYIPHSDRPDASWPKVPFPACTFFLLHVVILEPFDAPYVHGSTALMAVTTELVSNFMIP